MKLADLQIGVSVAIKVKAKFAAPVYNVLR